MASGERQGRAGECCVYCGWATIAMAHCPQGLEAPGGVGVLVACTLAGRLAFVVAAAVVFAGLDEPAHEGAHTFVIRGLV